MSKLVVTGCSVSSGWGFNPLNPFSDYPQASDLWVNLLHKNTEQLVDHELINLAKGGSSNADIFESALDAITNIIDDESSELWVQWTSLFRLNFDAGVELYPTNIGIRAVIQTECNVLRTNQYVITEKFLKKLSNELFSIMHPHGQICKVLKYVNIINNLCQTKKIKVRHINGFCPWDKNYFVKLTGPDIKPSDYTTYTKEKILFVNNRDDNEIFKLYNKLHNDYQPLISAQEQTWVNLDTSLYSLQLPNDYNHDKIHPGIASNQVFFKFLKKSLTK
jgi:hypothetical protein